MENVHITGPLLAYARALAACEALLDRILGYLQYPTQHEALTVLLYVALDELSAWTEDDPRRPELQGVIRASSTTWKGGGHDLPATFCQDHRRSGQSTRPSTPLHRVVFGQHRGSTGSPQTGRRGGDHGLACHPRHRLAVGSLVGWKWRPRTQDQEPKGSAGVMSDL
jgi:hypothetical protein